MSIKKQGRPRSSDKHPKHVMLDKVPPYVWFNPSGRGRWMLKYFDNDLEKWRDRKLCSSTATLAEIWGHYEKTKTKTQVTFLSLSLEFQQTKTWSEYAKSTRQDYVDCHKEICRTLTSKGILLGEIPITAWSTPMVRKYLDKREITSPTRANHELAYFKAICKWAVQRGKIKENFAQPLQKSKTNPKQHNPADKDYELLLKVAKADSVYDYMWPAMELAYLCKMRLIEVFELSDAHCESEAFYVSRHKGSRDSKVEWNDRLREAINALISRREAIFNKKKKNLPTNPEERFLFYSYKTGDRIAKESLKTAMSRIKAKAKEQYPDEFNNFSFHDLKRKGVTDTEGTEEDKMRASGHRSRQMMKVYNKEVPVVKPTKD